MSTSAVNRQTEKRAVVVIHGMGEQRPMSTLRGFADAVLPGDHHSETRLKFFSKPDLMSELMDVRKLSDARKTITLDFYEYYWAHQSGFVRFFIVLTWLICIVCRPWRWSARSSRPLLTLIAFLISIILSSSYLIYLVISDLPELWQNISKHNIGLGDLLGVGSTLLAIILYPFTSFIIHYFGDAEQYLHATPSNIAFRQKVRQEGIRLLERLHET